MVSHRIQSPMPNHKDAGNAKSLSPLRITIGGNGSKPYKSIDHLIWEDIPPFSVVTGLNGSGKTQLLELLAYFLTKTNYHDFDLNKPVPIETRVLIEGDTFDPGSVVF